MRREGVINFCSYNKLFVCKIFLHPNWTFFQNFNLKGVRGWTTGLFEKVRLGFFGQIIDRPCTTSWDFFSKVTRLDFLANDSPSPTFNLQGYSMYSRANLIFLSNSMLVNTHNKMIESKNKIFIKMYYVRIKNVRLSTHLIIWSK